MAQQNEEQRVVVQVAPAPCSVGDYFKCKVLRIQNRVFRSSDNAHNFELKPATTFMIQNSCQYGGMPHEDPNAHMARF